jgi:hypothetical protein
MEIPLALGGDGADSREVSVGPPCLEHGRVAHRGIGVDHPGQGVESSFSYEEEALLSGLRPLLMAG